MRTVDELREIAIGVEQEVIKTAKEMIALSKQTIINLDRANTREELEDAVERNKLELEVLFAKGKLNLHDKIHNKAVQENKDNR